MKRTTLSLTLALLICGASRAEQPPTTFLNTELMNSCYTLGQFANVLKGTKVWESDDEGGWILTQNRADKMSGKTEASKFQFVLNQENGTMGVKRIITGGQDIAPGNMSAADLGGAINGLGVAQKWQALVAQASSDLSSQGAAKVGRCQVEDKKKTVSQKKEEAKYTTTLDPIRKLISGKYRCVAGLDAAALEKCEEPLNLDVKTTGQMKFSFQCTRNGTRVSLSGTTSKIECSGESCGTAMLSKKQGCFVSMEFTKKDNKEELLIDDWTGGYSYPGYEHCCFGGYRYEKSVEAVGTQARGSASQESSKKKIDIDAALAAGKSCSSTIDSAGETVTTCE